MAEWFCTQRRNLNNFVIYYCDARSRVGGVLIAVSNIVPSHQIFTSSIIEIVIVDLALSPELTVRCFYIPPVSSDHYLNEILKSWIHSLLIVVTLLLVILMLCISNGMLDLVLHSFHFPYVILYTTHVVSMNLVQLVHEPTHMKGSILELVFEQIPLDKVISLVVDQSSSKYTSPNHCIHNYVH